MDTVRLLHKQVLFVFAYVKILLLLICLQIV